MRRLTGHLPNPPGPDKPAAELFGAFASLPDGVDLRGHAGEVLSQRFEDCVANATSKALQVLWSIDGIEDPPLPARWAIYRRARARHGALGKDEGTYPRLAFLGFKEEGFCLESFARYEEADPFKPLPLSAEQHSFDQGGSVEEYLCSASPAQRVLEIKKALAALHPVCLGLTLDEAFCAPGEGPGEFWRYRGSPQGKHYVCALGYSEKGLLILNSWGAGWGKGGLCTVAWDTVADPSLTSDVHVVTRVRKTTEMP